MEDLEKDIKKYLEERAWDNLRPGDLAKSVSIEAAELLENFQWSNPSLQELKADKDKLEEVKKELADILIYCLDISVLLDLDTESIIREKLEYIKKKYPPEIMKDRGGKEPGTDSNYWDIKKKHRKAN